MDHIHPEIRSLCDKVGMTLSKRHTWRRPVWDGETLGTFFYNRHHHCFMPLSDADILHEVCHYVVADPCQRDLPEYGLGYIAAFHGSQAYTPNVVDDFGRESEAQEMSCWILACMLGPAMGISPLSGDQKQGRACMSGQGWDYYFRHKLNEIQECDCRYDITLIELQARAFAGAREFGLL